MDNDTINPRLVFAKIVESVKRSAKNIIKKNIVITPNISGSIYKTIKTRIVHKKSVIIKVGKKLLRFLTNLNLSFILLF